MLIITCYIIFYWFLWRIIRPYVAMLALNVEQICAPWLGLPGSSGRPQPNCLSSISNSRENPMNFHVESTTYHGIFSETQQENSPSPNEWMFIPLTHHFPGEDPIFHHFSHGLTVKANKTKNVPRGKSCPRKDFSRRHCAMTLTSSTEVSKDALNITK